MNPKQNELNRDEEPIQDVSADEAEKVAGGDGTIQPPQPAPGPTQDGHLADI